MKEKESRINFRKLIYNTKKKESVFREIPVNEQGFVLIGLSRRVQHDILSKLKESEIANFLHYLDPDVAARILQNASSHKREDITKSLSKRVKEKVEFLLSFDPKTAAGLMNLHYISVEKKSTFGEVRDVIEKHEKSTGKVPAVLVVEGGFLMGEIPWNSLVLRKPEEKIESHIRRIATIKYNKKQDEVIGAFKKHPHNKFVVLDDDNSVLGVIFSDDVLRLITKKSAGSLYDFAGVSQEEDIYDSALTKVRYRYKWLIINLATAFLAASVVGLFQDTISAFVLLAVYMPVVAGMGGNAGTQTLAVTVRGLALGEIELKTGRKAIMSEMFAGATNGVINGILVATVAFFLHATPLLGLIVGVAMVVNLVIAGLFGALVPLVMKRLGKDPASSATIFITTATDVLGFLVFLGLATIILPI
jgi:magnesium transporter